MKQLPRSSDGQDDVILLSLFHLETSKGSIYYAYHTPPSKSYTQISLLGRKTSSSATDCRQNQCNF